MPEYIEREAAIKDVMVAKWKDGADGAMAMQIVATVPAADVGSHLPVRSVLDDSHRESAPPMVHGRWEERIITVYVGFDKDSEPIFADRRYFVHRECGRRSAIKEAFCPRCGAKMDLEESHEH